MNKKYDFYDSIFDYQFDKAIDELEEAEKKNLNVFPFKNYEAWEGHAFEEYKDFWVNEEKGYTASDIKRAKEDLARFKNVNFDLIAFNKE